METVFGSLACWNCSFLKDGFDKHSHGLNYRLAEEYLAKLGRVSRESIQEVVSILNCYLLPVLCCD